MKSLNKINPAIYNSIYSRRIKNSVLDEIDAEIIEDDEILSLRCNGFLAKGDLSRYKDFLQKYIDFKSSTEKKILLDIGCGFGGLGRWVSRKLDLHLIGIDFSEVAIKQAKTTVGHKESHRFQFHVSSFYETGLEKESIAAAISLDALYLATNPFRAFNEIGRILQSNAPLMFTVYLESFDSDQNRFNINFVDWKSVLQSTGFSIIHCSDTTQCWRIQMRKKHEHRWSRQEKIREELGYLGEAELSVSESMLGLNGKLSFIESVSRFEIGAIKDPS